MDLSTFTKSVGSKAHGKMTATLSELVHKADIEVDIRTYLCRRLYLGFTFPSSATVNFDSHETRMLGIDEKILRKAKAIVSTKATDHCDFLIGHRREIYICSF
jgi:hypothetical protein